MVAEANKKSFGKSISKFFREVKAEMKKVTWPSKKTLISYTSVVLVSCLIAAVLLGITDLGFSKIIDLLVSN